MWTYGWNSIKPNNTSNLRMRKQSNFLEKVSFRETHLSLSLFIYIQSKCNRLLVSEHRQHPISSTESGTGSWSAACLHRSKNKISVRLTWLFSSSAARVFSFQSHHAQIAESGTRQQRRGKAQYNYYSSDGDGGGVSGVEIRKAQARTPRRATFQSKEIVLTSVLLPSQE